MKMLILAFATAYLLILPVTAQSLSGEPNLQETLSWLSDRLTSDATFSPVDKSGKASTLMFGFAPLRFQSCEIEWKTWIGSSLSGQSGYTVETISLSKLDGSKASVESMSTDGSVLGVSLGMTDGTKEIKSQYFSKGNVSL